MEGTNSSTSIDFFATLIYVSEPYPRIVMSRAWCGVECTRQGHQVLQYCVVQRYTQLPILSYSKALKLSSTLDRGK